MKTPAIPEYFCWKCYWNSVLKQNTSMQCQNQDINLAPALLGDSLMRQSGFCRQQLKLMSWDHKFIVLSCLASIKHHTRMWLQEWLSLRGDWCGLSQTCWGRRWETRAGECAHLSPGDPQAAITLKSPRVVGRKVSCYSAGIWECVQHGCNFRVTGILISHQKYLFIAVNSNQKCMR